MRGAWYVVEVFCLLSIYQFLAHLVRSTNDLVLLALTVGEFSLILLLFWLTFRGKRIASRLFSAYIAASAVSYVWSQEVQTPGFDVYRAYALGFQAYLLLGAIKLWRIKELPTRFTDPPEHA